SFTTLVNIEIERRYDNLDFELLPLDLCDIAAFFFLQTNAALRCERRLAILERSETAKRCESLLNALLALYLAW
ncbi:hypothetical protein ACS8UU_004538, partial [Vibrio parahaemolyticus]